MSAAYETLVGFLHDDRPFARTRAELEPLWLAAASERLQQQRARIPVLGRLADERGIEEIRTFADLVPLLFAHSNYKSYPDAFLTKGRWDLMNRWLDTLRSESDDVRDIVGSVDGVLDPTVEAVPEEPVLTIETDLARAEPFGIKPGDVRRASAMLLQGVVVGNIFGE